MLKILYYYLLVVSLGVSSITIALPTTARAEYDYERFQIADIDTFVDELSPYGSWQRIDNYPRVWVPRRVGQSWRPYSVGHWVASDRYGWIWVSNEPWGWATYHYGRWMYHPMHGWVWIPDTTWGPAWVSWQRSPDWVGWAPLPPQAVWRPSSGLDFGGSNINFYSRPDSYCFVHRKYFLEPRIDRVVLQPARNVTILKETKNVTNYITVNREVVNRSISIEEPERWTGKKTRVVQVVDREVSRRATPEERARFGPSNRTEVQRVDRPVDRDIVAHRREEKIEDRREVRKDEKRENIEVAPPRRIVEQRREVRDDRQEHRQEQRGLEERKRPEAERVGVARMPQAHVDQREERRKEEPKRVEKRGAKGDKSPPPGRAVSKEEQEPQFQKDESVQKQKKHGPKRGKGKGEENEDEQDSARKESSSR